MCSCHPVHISLKQIVDRSRSLRAGDVIEQREQELVISHLASHLVDPCAARQDAPSFRVFPNVAGRALANFRHEGPELAPIVARTRVSFFGVSERKETS